MLEQFTDEADRSDYDAPVRRRRRGRRVLAAVLSLLLLLLAGTAGFVWFLNSKLSNIAQDDLLPTTAAGGTTGGDGGDAGGKPLVTGMGENYLIIGSDARPGDTFSRSDVIIIAHVTEKKDKVYLMHFPRDLYVSIPGKGKDKINAAFAYGGSPLLVRTLQGMLGVKIDHAAKIDFHGFMNMTDAVGGVRVWAEEASDEGTFQVVKGWNDLTGAQALDFVRERKSLSEGDISRGRRQLAFIKALMVKTLSPGVLLNPVKLSHFMEAATSNLVVDRGITPKFMRAQAMSLRDLRADDIVFITAPFTGFGTAPNGGAIDIVDERRMEELGLALQSDDVAGYLANDK